MKSMILVMAIATGLGATVSDAEAGTAFGIGVTYVFGDNDVAVGARVFSDDQPNKVVLSAGLDYKFGSGSIRPNIGAAYLEDNIYIDAGLGYDFIQSDVDFGVGIGGLFNMQSGSGTSGTPPMAAALP